MKITLEIPDRIVQRAKREAERRSVSLQQFLTDATVDKLGPEQFTPEEARAARMKWAGALSHLKEETARIDAVIEEEFEKLD